MMSDDERRPGGHSIRWEPLPDGFFQSSINTGLYAVAVEGDALKIFMLRMGEWQDNAIVVLPDNIRLCRATPAPVPQPLEMPVEVWRTLRSATRHWREFLADNISNMRYSEKDRERDDNIDAALAWLEQQRP